MTDKEFVNLQRVGLTLGRPLTLPFLQFQWFQRGNRKA